MKPGIITFWYTHHIDLLRRLVSYQEAGDLDPVEPFAGNSCTDKRCVFKIISMGVKF